MFPGFGRIFRHNVSNTFRRLRIIFERMRLRPREFAAAGEMVFRHFFFFIELNNISRFSVAHTVITKQNNSFFALVNKLQNVQVLYMYIYIYRRKNHKRVFFRGKFVIFFFFFYNLDHLTYQVEKLVFFLFIVTPPKTHRISKSTVVFKRLSSQDESYGY